MFVRVQSYDLIFLNENIVRLFGACWTLALTSLEYIDRSSRELSTKVSISVDDWDGVLYRRMITGLGGRWYVKSCLRLMVYPSSKEVSFLL